MSAAATPTASRPSPAGRAGRRVPAGRTGRWGALAYLGPITLFYGVALVLPYLLVLRLSFYTYSSTKLYVPAFTLANYRAVISDPFYLGLMARTVGLGVLVTAVTIVLSFPLALTIVRSGPFGRNVLMAITLSPLLINLLVRTYAWIVLLGSTGIVNNGLRALGLVDAPLPLNGNLFAVVIGLVHIGLPLMVLSIVSVMETIEPAVLDAAASLGGSPARILRRIVLPLSLPGVAAGSLLVFGFTISAFVTPSLLGGNRVSTVSTLIYEKFTFSVNWPVGATLVVVLLVINAAVLVLHGRVFRDTRT